MNDYMETTNLSLQISSQNLEVKTWVLKRILPVGTQTFQCKQHELASKPCSKVNILKQSGRKDELCIASLACTLDSSLVLAKVN